MPTASLPENITSGLLHSQLRRGEVLDCRSLRDDAAGILPCYYARDQHRLVVSTSALCLIRFLGKHRRDR